MIMEELVISFCLVEHQFFSIDVNIYALGFIQAESGIYLIDFKTKQTFEIFLLILKDCLCLCLLP